MNRHVSTALSVLLLSAVTGCASGPFRHKPAPVATTQPEAPELSQTPLYSAEMSENNPRLPSLPATAERPIVPAPLPVVEKPKRPRKSKPPAAIAKTQAPPVRASDGQPSGTPAQAASGAGNIGASADAPATSPVAEKRTASQQASTAAAPASPIGELTAGSAQDAAQTNQQTTDLIKATHDGLEGIKRQLSAEEKKTVAEIGTFLSRAQQALNNGDGDGAFGLATKAKLLLDELTQQ